MSKSQKNKKNKKNKKNRLFLKLTLFIVIGYVSYILVNQQTTLNKYISEMEYYQVKIEEEKSRKEELVDERDNINSDKYIEQVAREKLGYIMPNETMYIDANRY